MTKNNDDAFNMKGEEHRTVVLELVFFFIFNNYIKAWSKHVPLLEVKWSWQRTKLGRRVLGLRLKLRYLGSKYIFFKNRYQGDYVSHIFRMKHICMKLTCWRPVKRVWNRILNKSCDIHRTRFGASIVWILLGGGWPTGVKYHWVPTQVGEGNPWQNGIGPFTHKANCWRPCYETGLTCWHIYKAGHGPWGTGYRSLWWTGCDGWWSFPSVNQFAAQTTGTACWCGEVGTF